MAKEAVSVAAPTPQHQTAPKDWWFIVKLICAVLVPPLAVFLELHSFDKIPLILYGIALLLWVFGWLPGIIFALFIVLSSTARNKILGWFEARHHKPENPAAAHK